jgi:dihydrofolate synthase/folylpolyglutamate synthase
MNYASSVDYLLSLLGAFRDSQFGLERMERLMAELGRPDKAFRTIHIAGTNGKGSTAAMIASALHAAGRTTGLSTSPHLIRFNERVRLNNADISDGDFAAAVEEVRAANESISAVQGPNMHSTFFESVTAVAFCAFRRARVEWGVVEVGLGGRLDATNVVEPELAVITPVSRDHERFLGSALRSIAREKAGILKAGCPAVIAEQTPEAAQAIRERADELGIRLVESNKAWRADGVTNEAGFYRFNAVPETDASGGREAFPVTLGLAGEHQVTNALTAIASLDVLGIETAAIQQGFAEVLWPGRLERIAGDPEFLVDAAHNPAGATVLARFLKEHCGDRTVHLIYGSSSDKPMAQIAEILFPCVDRVVLTASRVTRSISAEDLLNVVGCYHNDVTVQPTIENALEWVEQHAGPGDLVVVAGSIFLVGEAKADLKQLVAQPVGQ